MMESTLRKSLTEEMDAAEKLLSDLIDRADEQLEDRNKRRRRERSQQDKRSRRSTARHRSVIFRPLPDRAAAYDAFARLLVCQRLLSKIDFLEAGIIGPVLDKLRGEALPVESDRQAKKIPALYLRYLDEWSAKLAREQDRSADQEGAGELKGGVDDLYAALTVRADGIRQALAVLEIAQVSDRLAATVYLREAARLAVLERFTTSNHLASAKTFCWKASLIKLEFPTSLTVYGDLGRAAWAWANDEFKQEIMAWHLVNGSEA
jgi:hypothetical protein